MTTGALLPSTVVDVQLRCTVGKNSMFHEAAHLTLPPALHPHLQSPQGSAPHWLRWTALRHYYLLAF